MKQERHFIFVAGRLHIFQPLDDDRVKVWLIGPYSIQKKFLPLEMARKRYAATRKLQNAYLVEVSDGEALARALEARLNRRRHKGYLKATERRAGYIGPTQEDYTVGQIKEFNRQRFTGTLPAEPRSLPPIGLLPSQFESVLIAHEEADEDWFANWSTK